MKRQQCVHRPAMVRDPRRHGRGRLLRLGQTLMGCAKVRDRAYQAQALVPRHGMAGQRPATARQRSEAFPETAKLLCPSWFSLLTSCYFAQWRIVQARCQNKV
jgi:hypothetical protein